MLSDICSALIVGLDAAGRPSSLEMPFAVSGFRDELPRGIAAAFGVRPRPVDMRFGPAMGPLEALGVPGRTAKRGFEVAVIDHPHISGPCAVMTASAGRGGGPAGGGASAGLPSRLWSLVVRQMNAAYSQFDCGGLGIAFAGGEFVMGCFGAGQHRQAFDDFAQAFAEGDLMVSVDMRRAPFGSPVLRFTIPSRLTDDERRAFTSADIFDRLVRERFDASGLWCLLRSEGFSEDTLRSCGFIHPMSAVIRGAGFDTDAGFIVSIDGLGLDLDGGWATVRQVEAALDRRVLSGRRVSAAA